MNVKPALVVQTDHDGYPYPLDNVATQQFEADVKDYIKTYRLKWELIARMKDIVVCFCVTFHCERCMHGRWFLHVAIIKIITLLLLHSYDMDHLHPIKLFQTSECLMLLDDFDQRSSWINQWKLSFNETKSSLVRFHTITLFSHTPTILTANSLLRTTNKRLGSTLV